jgi:ribosomal protein S18 acetylase RimI-like enzyme
MLTTRRATSEDALLIASHRHSMFAEMGKSEPAALEEMRLRFVPWAERMITAAKYVGWVVLDGEKPVASGGFFELDWPPHPLDPTAEHRGYLLNFWVDPAYRGQGIARTLVREGLAESKRRGIRVTALHASEAGRRVYERMGFSATSEMFHIDSGLGSRDKETAVIRSSE